MTTADEPTQPTHAPSSDILARLLSSHAARTTKPFPIKTKTYNSAHRKNAICKRITDAKDARARRTRTRLVRPENAEEVAAQMPAPGDSAHSILSGDFVFCDLLPAVCRLPSVGSLVRLDVATLSLSLKNIETLAQMIEPNRVPFHLILSHYFKGTNVIIFSAVAERLNAMPYARLTVGRTHCKVCVMDFGENVFVIESSANLRTSQNIEQLSIFNDADHAQFHREWMEELSTLTQ